MSNAKLDAIEKKLSEDLARINAEFQKRLAQLNDINNDPALEPPVQLEEGYNTCVIVTNVPVVDEAMHPKLLGVLCKIALKCGSIQEQDVYLPVDPQTKKTLG
jgi:hypothetical protein